MNGLVGCWLVVVVAVKAVSIVLRGVVEESKKWKGGKWSIT
jgi:hypothetical protein